jgi:hypothetical protein
LKLSHETDEQLELYGLGRLTEPRVAIVGQHLLVCEACQERLDDVERFALAMRQATADGPEAQAFKGWFERLRFRGLRQPALAWAGGFATLLFAAGLYLHSDRNLVPFASLQLSATRGDLQTAVTAGETDITLADAPALQALKAEVVDDTGGLVWSGAFENGHPIKLLKPVAVGTYFVRLYDGAGKLLHEYGFHVSGIL